jgi:hypothetical protein
MADITRIARLIDGLMRNVDLSANALVVGSLKVGASSPVELTKAILNNLLALQNGTDFADGTSAHTHDARYSTKADLASVANAKGASLVGIEDVAGKITATTVEGALAEFIVKIESLRTLSGVVGSDLGTFTGSVIPDASTIKDALQSLETSVESKVSKSGSSMVSAANITFSGGGEVLGLPDTPSISSAAVSKKYLDTTIATLGSMSEWLNSALSILNDPPVAPTLGDRHLIDSAPTGAWAGKSDQIAEWDGLAWTFIVPHVGTYLSIDNISSSIMYYGGTSWIAKQFENTTASTGLTKVGNDIRLDSSSAGSGLGFSSGVLAVNVDGTSIEVNADAIRIASGVAGSGLGYSAGVLAVNVDGTSIEVDTDAIRIASGAAGSGLGYSAGVLAVNVDGTSIEVNADALRIASGVAGDGLAYTAGVLSVGVDGTTVELASDKVQVKDLGIGTDKIASSAVTKAKIAADVAGVGLSQNVSGALDVVSAPVLLATKIAGESFLINTSFVVRLAVDGETAGRIYKADKDAGTSNLFFAIGIMKSFGLTSGGSASVVSLGTHVLGSADTPFNATDIGKPVFLGASGAFSVTPPSAVSEAVVKIGIVEDTDKIFIQPQLHGIL